MSVHYTPIGFMKTCFMEKNGTPRQPSVSSLSKGELKILKSVFNNPEHSVEGLSDFSHVWILFVFHLNSGKAVKAKVKPPRLNGLKTGVFSTRAPYRPNPIGLTLAKLESIDNDTLYFSGIDIVNDTPVLDIKPYISSYDCPQISSSGESCKTSVSGITSSEKTPIKTSHSEQGQSTLSYKDDKVVSNCSVAKWIEQPAISGLDVLFSNRALHNLSHFHSGDENFSCDWMLNQLKPEELQSVITDVLRADPRSSYRRNKCSDRLYYFIIDNVHITAWFDETVTPNCAEVLRVVPKSFVRL